MGKILEMIGRICKRFDISILYQTKVGIKCTNQLLSSDMFKYFVSGETKYVPAKNLWLAIDGLKDSYSLIGRPVADSPHFELMQLLQEENPATLTILDELLMEHWISDWQKKSI